MATTVFYYPSYSLS